MLVTEAMRQQSPLVHNVQEGLLLKREVCAACQFAERRGFLVVAARRSQVRT
jgi:hypothetical protein